MSVDQKKVDGQRAAVREHVSKYLSYEDEAKNMALRTVRNAQEFITSIRAKAPSIKASWEDFWDPEGQAPEGYEPPEQYRVDQSENYGGETDGDEEAEGGEGEGGEEEAPEEEPAEA